jgi:ribosome-associated protein
VLATGLSERTLRRWQMICSADSGRRTDRAAPAEGGCQRWILLDFGSVVVHILSPAQRNYYKLEELWREGRVVLRIA